MTQAFQKLPVPGFTSPTVTYDDAEILYSTAAFTQKGVTLAGGQGILPAGTVLGQRTADKLYYVYNNALTGTGQDVAAGVLRMAADTRNGPVQGNIVIQGILRNSMVSGADTQAMTDLGAVRDTVRDTFKF